MTTPTTPSILVLGAGELGMAVLTQLATHLSTTTTTHSLHVLLRPQSKPPRASESTRLSALAALGITPIHGDLATLSVADLARLFAPYDTLISCTGFVAGAGTQLKLCRAALAAGVRRYLPWQFGIDYDVLGRGSAQELFDEQLQVRDLLRGQTATEWVIVSVGMFMSFLFEAFWGVVDVDGRRVVALGGWENRVTVTAVEDIARCTAEIVVAAPRIRNEVVFLGGEIVSYGRLADIMDRVLGEKVEREVWSVKKLEEELAREPEEQLRKYKVVFGKGTGCAWEMDRTFNFQRGIETTGVETWVKENLIKGR